MATAGDIDECDICTELLKHPRVLHCDHVYCLNCLEKLERNKTIICPTCMQETKIPRGLQVKHLQKKKVRPQEKKTSNTNIIQSWTLEHQITDVLVDDETGVLYLGTGDKDKPVKMYDLTGRYTDYLSSDIDIHAATLGLDTKRGLLLAVKRLKNKSAIVMFDREGMEVGIIRCPEFTFIDNITYHRSRDVYIVADIGAHCLYYIDPNNYKVVKTIPAATDAEIQEDTDMFISCYKSGQVSVWATADWNANTVRLYDADGSCIKVWNNTGSGYGQFDRPDGLFIDTKGHILVSDWGNDRIVQIDPGHVGERGEWKVLVNTKQYKLGRPRMIDMTEDGLAAVVMWDNLPGPYNLALMDGLAQF